MMEPSIEIARLLDIMPASGRMMTKLVSKPEQSTIIEAPFPLPLAKDRLIFINFDLWQRLSLPQRDMLLLRTVSWLVGIEWFKPDLYQGLVAAGVLGSLVELVQADAVGMVTAAGLSCLAGVQIWRSSRSTSREIWADEAAIAVAQRRGYTETEAAAHLLSAIEAVAKIEGRVGESRAPALDFTELIRCQNLRAIAGLSAVGVPDTIKREERF